MIKGKCDGFCPKSEIHMRIEQKLLHFYEYGNPEKKLPGVLIKEFSRSAAGVKMPKPKDLRTPLSMEETEQYLMKNILKDTRKPYHVAYDFIFDRLRAVRQEMVIQSLDEMQIISLLEPMIMFLAYSRYKLCEELKNFDPKICELHLQECLKRTLTCYDSTECDQMTFLQLKRRVFIESMYQVFNLGTIEPLHRGVTLPTEIKGDPLFKKAFSIAMNYYRGNFWRSLHKIKSLPHIMCAIAVTNIQILRRNLLSIFAHAYSSKHFTVPVDFVAKLTLMASKDLISDCTYYNIEISENKRGIRFQKSNVKSDKPVRPLRKEKFVEQKLEEIYEKLPSVILLHDF